MRQTVEHINVAMHVDVSYPRSDPSPNCWPDSNMLCAKAVWWSFL